MIAKQKQIGIWSKDKTSNELPTIIADFNKINELYKNMDKPYKAVVEEVI